MKKLIVDALKLEDVSPDDIDAQEPLFGDGGGLGLDSIDALELGVAIRKTFGIKIDTVTEDVRHHFASIHNLANFIRAQQGNAE
ncbi:phosphopantetheine-binding protein [Magnetospirillum sulfuroxidans]|uniref:phosphopantetheine-binding protein n=1 Tax=Magnetospirillum sulfuroxidans TaxID=611300 RepID=UPI002012DDFB|nr:phosphopantetheine-binding protein [Magnetospirillum sulfuroxidans]